MNELLEKYAQIAGQEIIDQLQMLAIPLKNMKVLHINSTRIGGGVAEILTKMVPLMEALGISTKWEVIEGTPDFFHCTKTFHNAIQGMRTPLASSYLRAFENVNLVNSERLRPMIEEADIIFIHDPQPLPLINLFPDHKGKWVWRCHIDASRPYRPIWNYLKNFVENFDASIFSLAEFSQRLSHPMFVILPSIDPLSDKNCDLDPQMVRETQALFEIDPDRPMILQVSRFDRFKDPIGVIQSYRLVKKFNPKVQLVLAGSSATDDPEGEAILKEVETAAKDDSDIHILLLPGDAHKTINALQRAADIILQKSTKEGFGLTVSEALWKGKPVIGGNTGGIKTQIINSQNGFLVNTPEGAAYHIRHLLHHPQKIKEMGEKGKEYVRERFLLTRQLREYLTLIYSLYSKDEERIEINGANLEMAHL